MPLGTEVGLGQDDFVLDGDPFPPPKKRGHRPHSFRPMSIVAKRSPVSAAAELLLTLLIVAKNVCYIVDFV